MDFLRPYKNSAARSFAALAAALTAVGMQASGPVPSYAQDQPVIWVLEEFSVTHFDYGEPSRNEVMEASKRQFSFGTDYSLPDGPSYSGRGALRINVPDRIVGGTEYSVGATVQGDLTATDLPADGELATLDGRSLCWSGSAEGRAHDEERVMPGGGSITMNATVADTAHVAPRDGPPVNASHNCEFNATLGVGFAVRWQILVQAQYVALGPGEPYLSLDANPTNLPPSGATPSESVLTANLSTGSGQGLEFEAVEFTLDPPGFGRLSAGSSTTDARGNATVRYIAPTAAELAGREVATIRARVPARGLERTTFISVEQYRMAMSIDPAELPVTDPPAVANLRVAMETFDGRPVADDIVEFSIDDPDMGQLLGDGLLENRAVTDAQGVIELLYEAPPAAILRGRDQVTIHARGISHVAEASVSVRLLGLHVVATAPGEGERDVDLTTGDEVSITFDRSIDPASVTASSIAVETLWHGNLAPRLETFGSGVRVFLTQNPIPDVGLKVTVRVRSGPGGVRGRDGSLLARDFDVRFLTMPKLDPRLTVSQVVDDPRDPVHGVISLAAKPFAVRLDAGISADSELSEELVTVSLTSPDGGADSTLTHRYFPGRWPPTVPPSVVKQGNTANFVFSEPLSAGGHTFAARLRPAHAGDDKTVEVPPVTVNLNAWIARRDPSGLHILGIPISSEAIRPAEWTGFFRNPLVRWAARTGNETVTMLPLESVQFQIGYIEDASCNVDCRFAQSPSTSFRHWVRQVGRAGFATPWAYVVALVPPLWFETLAEHPDLAAHPADYHNFLESRVWSDGSPVPLLEADTSAVSLIHALGDSIQAPHSTASRDVIQGYDVTSGRAMISDDGQWTGAYLSVMNEAAATGPAWMSRGDYELFLNRWTVKHCAGTPPCGPVRAANATTALPEAGLAANATGAQLDAIRPTSATRAALDAARIPVSHDLDRLMEQGAGAEPVVGVSGTLSRGSGSEVGVIEPLIPFEGEATLGEGGSGEYAIVVTDELGGQKRYAFEPVWSYAEGGSMASFLYAVPRPASMVSVEVVRGAASVTRVSRSEFAPVVTFTAPVAGARSRGNVPVAWSGTDADGDRLTYSLFMSADAGSTWLPLMMDSTATDLVLGGNDVPNGPDVRLKLAASDGFLTGEAILPLALDGPLAVVAVWPEDGARDVSTLTTVRVVLRDPLFEPSVQQAFQLRDASGRVVPGTVEVDDSGSEVSFKPQSALRAAARYEARLGTAARTPDGRALASDLVWQFTTRGLTQVFLPWSAHRSEAPPPPPARSPTPGGRVTPTRPVPTTPTRTATATRGTAVSPTPTATLVDPTTPTPTTTSTAGNPDTPTPTPTPTSPGIGVQALAALTTGADDTLFRSAFAPGETIKLWIQVSNTRPSASTTNFDFTVVGDSGSAPSELAWSGPLEVPPGVTWYRIERAVPGAGSAPPGPYRLVATVDEAGVQTFQTADFFIAQRLVRADDFSAPGSGWPSSDDANARSGYLDGAFQILIKTPQIWRIDWPQGVLLGDFATEADLRFVGSPFGAAGLVGEVSADGNAFALYNVVKDGRFGVFRRGNGQWTTLAPFATAPELATNGTANHVMFVRQDGEFRVYANGQRLATIDAGGGADGRVGFYAEGTEGGLDARLDNFRAYEVP